jgi:hypothetical protein
MKAAISIPDREFAEAELLARRLGISRSELYSRAVSDYVESQRFVGVRERLDAVYAAAPADAELDPDVVQAQTNSLTRERW